MALACRLPGAEIARRAPSTSAVLPSPVAAAAAPPTPAAAREEESTWSEPRS
jgi:hypothetical protein